MGTGHYLICQSLHRLPDFFYLFLFLSHITQIQMFRIKMTRQVPLSFKERYNALAQPGLRTY